MACLISVYTLTLTKCMGRPNKLQLQCLNTSLCAHAGG